MIDKNRIKKILFISLSNIGDIILTTPAMRILSENFSRAQMDVMVGPRGAELFQNHPAVRNVISYNKHMPLKEKRELVKNLRKSGYDLVADMRNSLFPFLLGAKYRTSPFPVPPRKARHKKQQHIWKISSAGLGIDTTDAPFYLHAAPADNTYIDGLLADIDKRKPVIAVSPGAKSKIKRWPAERYAELAKRLAEELGGQIIMAGDEHDRALIKEKIMPAVHYVRDLSGKTTLCQLAALLSRCDLLITNDSAPMHVGTAVNTRVLAIFGPTDPAAYGPTGAGDRVLRVRLDCSPCKKAQCDFEHECMDELSVEEVFKTAKKMIAEK